MGGRRLRMTSHSATPGPGECATRKCPIGDFPTYIQRVSIAMFKHSPLRRVVATRRLSVSLIALALSSPALAGAQALAAPEASDNLKHWQMPWLVEESLRSGLAAETPYFVDGEEISALAEGLDAFFADGGRIEAQAGEVLYGVGLKLDGDSVSGLTWVSYDASGKPLHSGTVEITWSEGIAHVGRIRLPQPAQRVELQRGKTQLSFLQAEPLTEPMAKSKTLARDLPFETATAKAPLPPGVVSRSAWGARATGACGTGHNPNYLTVHHTATPNNDSMSAAARMRQMQAFHIDNRGWCDLGYHYSVGIDGRVYEGRNPDRTGAHVGDHNTDNVGISVVGTFVNFNPRESQLSALTDISRWVVNRYDIPKRRSNIRGHNEWSGHTSNACPGLLRPFLPTLVERLIGPTPPPPPPASSTTVLESFEQSVGRFGSEPTRSGSTVGISTASTAQRSNIQARSGSWSLQVFLQDSATSSADWFVRLLSGGGTPASNARLQKAGGRLGAWFYTGATGVGVQYLVDDSDGTELSVARALPQNTWVFHEVSLDDAADWAAWNEGDGTITASSVTLDSIVIKREDTSFDVYVYIDGVSYRKQ